MDNKRFDSLTKSIASWTSRRKVLGGLIGLSAGGALTRAGAVSAQTATPGACPEPGNLDQLYIIQSDSKDILAHLPSSALFHKVRDPNFLTQPLFEQFVSHLEVLFTAGSTASDDKWSQREIDSWVHQVASVVPFVSIGFSGAFFSDQESAASPGGINALVNLAPSQTCTGLGCIGECLHTALLCYDPCNGNDECNYACVAPFITCLIGDASNPDTPSCLQTIAASCDSVDCCCGACH